MSGGRNPLRDTVAFASAASTGFTPHNTSRSRASFAAEACIAAIEACGADRADIDGICGSFPTAPAVQHMLGIPEITWFANPPTPFINQVMMAASAIFSGLCETVLAYHSSYRLPWNTPSSLKDPFRRAGSEGGHGGVAADSIGGPIAYASWASRYDYEHGDASTARGLIAVNGRTNARDNPLAAKREPMTMNDYLCSPMIRSPLRLFDMDVPVDGADAFVLTTAERARDLRLPAVLIDATAIGSTECNTEDGMPGLHFNGPHVVAKALRARCDFWIDGLDVFFPYDGFTSIALAWFEALGFCGPGEAAGFLSANWDAAGARLLLGDRRVPVNPHGGSLSEGATQGSGHVREAVHQLQGLAGLRQRERARTALVTGGGFFTNAQGLALRADDGAST